MARGHPFLHLDGLAKRFGEVEVLAELSLELAEGEILALLGLSGSGKTTALRLVAGFETPDRGRIVVGGEDVTGQAPAARGFGMVFQHYALFPHMTVEENVAFGLEARGWPRPRIAERVAAMLELIDLAGFGERRVSAISGGQQQRVALARALAPQPRVLLLDEPLSNLDPALRERTRRELRALVKQVGITTLLVTHEQEEAFDVGDRVAVLHRGRLEQAGSARQLYRWPASRFVATFVGRASVLPGTYHEDSDDGGWVRIDGEPENGNAVSWRGHATAGFAPGAAVELVVRPEALHLAAPSTPGTLAGEIAALRFTGPLTYAVVQLVNGREVEVLVDDERAAPGQEAFVAPRDQGPPPQIFPRTDGATS